MEPRPFVNNVLVTFSAHVLRRTERERERECVCVFQYAKDKSASNSL